MKLRESVVFFSFSFSFAYSLAQEARTANIFEAYIIGCDSFTALDLLTQVLWSFKFPHSKSWSSILLVRAAISDFLKVWFVYSCASWDNLWYIIKHIEEFRSILTRCLSGKWWVSLHKAHLISVAYANKTINTLYGNAHFIYCWHQLLG